MISSNVHANTAWDMDINKFKTSLTLEQNNNFFNKDRQQFTETSSVLAISNQTVQLFEGYAITLPFNLARLNYSQQSDLNSTAYRFSPGMHLFLSEYSGLTIAGSVAASELITGSPGAEFVTQGIRSIKVKRQAAKLSYQLGRAPQQQFVHLNAAYIVEQQRHQSLLLSDIETTSINATYGYRISEDSYLKFNSRFANQYRFDINSRLFEAGTGLLTSLGGSHQLDVIFGLFQRQGLIVTKGYYWSVKDQWLLSEQVTLNLNTSRQSQVATEQSSHSQLKTAYGLSVSYMINHDHHLDMAINYANIKLDANKSRYRDNNLSLAWRWIIYQGLSTDFRVSYQRTSNPLQMLAKAAEQSKLSFALRYLW